VVLAVETLLAGQDDSVRDGRDVRDGCVIGVSVRGRARAKVKALDAGGVRWLAGPATAAAGREAAAS